MYEYSQVCKVLLHVLCVAEGRPPFFMVMINSLLALGLGEIPTNSLYLHCTREEKHIYQDTQIYGHLHEQPKYHNMYISTLEMRTPH